MSEGVGWWLGRGEVWKGQRNHVEMGKYRGLSAMATHSPGSSLEQGVIDKCLYIYLHVKNAKFLSIFFHSGMADSDSSIIIDFDNSKKSLNW